VSADIAAGKNNGAAPAQPDGRVVAVGSRSTVREWGPDAVAKVPDAGVPASWIAHEFEFTQAVAAVGAPTHRPLEMRQYGEARCSLYRRVYGPTMWQTISDTPNRAAHFGELLGSLHARVLTTAPPISLPRQSDRLRCKLRRASGAVGATYPEVASTLPRAAATMSLCHGDFHPGNIIMSADGPLVVDWFDACRGDAAGDIARTSLLLGAGHHNTEHVRHLPGHTPQLLIDVHRAYLSSVCQLMAVDVRLVEQWRRVEAVARADEGVDVRSLIELWQTADA
jgi:aminoglycoside phosphotransferase (APT) family kinase protein